MAKSKKANLPWVDRFGELATYRLTAQHGRPFSFHQGGPYNQDTHPMVSVHINEPQFQNIPNHHPADKYDDRFGFLLQRQFDKRAEVWEIYAGFSLRNKVVVRSAFVPNVSSDYKRLGYRLAEWADTASEDGLVFNFDQLGGEKYYYEIGDPAQIIVDALSKYPDLDRKSSGIHKGKPAPWNGANFNVLQVLPEFNDLQDDESLLDHGQELADSATTVFDRLYFLYELLLPRSQHSPFESPSNKSMLQPPEIPSISADLLNSSDERTRILADVVQRQGQTVFRKLLLRAYRGRCAISGSDVEGALQAAHIIPYFGPKANDCSNGILLRADLHNLFDTGLLRIDPGDLTVKLAPELMTSYYGHLEGKRLNEPDDPSERPNREALRRRIELLGEGWTETLSR